MYFEDCPLFSEMPFKFNMTNFAQTGLDILFYGQEFYDTMAILDDNSRREINKDNIGELKESQQILSNRAVMHKNLSKLVENLQDCEEYIQSAINSPKQSDPEIGRMLNKCMGQFNSQDMQILEQLVSTNFRNAHLTNSLGKL